LKVFTKETIITVSVFPKLFGFTISSLPASYWIGGRMCGFDEDIKKLETVLQCQCGGNVFIFVKTDDVSELECVGCKKRLMMGDI